MTEELIIDFYVVKILPVVVLHKLNDSQRHLVILGTTLSTFS